MKKGKNKKVIFMRIFRNLERFKKYPEEETDEKMELQTLITSEKLKINRNKTY
jgi:hypothetical protein